MKILKLNQWKVFKPTKIRLKNNWNELKCKAMFSDDNIAEINMDLTKVVRMHRFKDESFLIFKVKNDSFMTIKVLTRDLDNKLN